MTAPTPERFAGADRVVEGVRYSVDEWMQLCHARAVEAGREMAGEDSTDWAIMVRWLATSLESAARHLAAVTAERDQARQMLAEQAVLEVHHHDLEAHAASFNEGWDEAVKQGLAAPRGEGERLRQMLADAWDEGVAFGWHSTELRTDANPYRRAGL